MKILTVDDELVSREKMKKIMDSYGECIATDTGRNALEIFKSAVGKKEPFDLITIDVSMPDMDGTEVLYCIRDIENNFLIPKENKAKAIMVTSRSDKDTIITCVQAGCNEYIVKPFDKNVIGQKLSGLGLWQDEQKSDDKYSIRNFVMQTVSSFKNGQIELPVLSHVVKDIQDEMKKTDSGVEEIAQLIEKDAVISMKLIATANSPAYRGSEKVHSVLMAIPRLGMKETQSIVSTIASKSMYETKDKNCKELMEKLWMHSFACACCTRAISSVIQYNEKEKLFMMALFHDIGKVLLLKTIGSNAGKDVTFDRAEVVESIQEVHTSFGAALLESWGFEREFGDIAQYHDWTTFKPDTKKEILVINLANMLARYMGYTIFDNDKVDISGIESAGLLGIDQEKLKAIINNSCDIISKTSLSSV
jgi:putative nucleotidyltransferase with HDIG domain